MKNTVYMTPDQLKEWQDHMGFKTKEASDELGIHINTYLNYRRGYRTMSPEENREVPIPKSVSVHCGALVMGLRDYNDINLKDYI